MSLFVYVTESCWRDAQKHGLRDVVEKFVKQVERSQSTSSFDDFPHPYLVKKKLGSKQGRLVAKIASVADQAVIVFLALMIKSSSEYDQFHRDSVEFGARYFADLVSESELEEEIAGRLDRGAIEPKPEPSGFEYGFLFGAFSHHANTTIDDVVCESAMWVEQMAEPRILNQLALLHMPCLNALACDPGLHYLAVQAKPGWGIWALRESHRLLLMAVSTPETTEQAESEAKRLEESVDSNDEASILRISRRAYPALILADDELWLELEREVEANMALSPEETEVLVSARNAENPFPLFINGRAGSGKSTILQYLFADLLYFHLASPEPEGAPPLYLTASSALLDVARRFVERLLRSEASFRQLSSAPLGGEPKEVLDEAFQAFEPLRLSLVKSDATLRERFAPGARVDYARFRKLWLERFGHDQKALRDYGPDLSWHVIRSYIKGRSSEEYLEPDEYTQLPANEITVTEEAYKNVYDKVWSRWYQSEIVERQLQWDDQDLTREILDSDLAHPTYPTILCDEAQDFTRLELELLLRLNLFSGRSIPPNSISRIPFAFAGDQFQTLNPTGFQWDAVKASFAEKFIFALDPARRSGRTDLNYRELKYNYRSAKPIVRFSNAVQALRAALFQIPDLKPQTPWATDASAYPVICLHADDASAWNHLREGDLVFVVPCGEGEELEYVQNDPVLSEQIPVADGVPINVLSAARAKGCEYPSVVVYGFGREVATDVLSQVRSGACVPATDPDHSLPMQYFINRLYVAVTRPKRRLMVLDTPEGFQRLWACMLDERSEGEMLDRIKNGRTLWQTEIGAMSFGSAEDVVRESAGDALANAVEHERAGVAAEDGFLLRQAAQAYRAANNLPKWRECIARALDFEGKHLDAGKAYFEAGFPGDGVRCLWRAGTDGRKSLAARAVSNPETANELEVRWARAVVEPTSTGVAVNVLEEFAKRLGETAFCDLVRGDSVWSEALGALLGRLVTLAGPESEAQLLARVVSAMDRIRDYGVGCASDSAGRLLYAVGRYSDAVALWDESGNTRSNEYAYAKARIEPYPQRAVALHKLSLFADIVNAFDGAPEAELNLEQTHAVVSALTEAGRRADAFDVAWRNAAHSSMLELAGLLFADEERDQAAVALQAAIRLMVRRKEWPSLTPLIMSRKFNHPAIRKSAQGTTWLAAQSESLIIEMVRELARSDGFAAAAPSEQRPIADFLRKYLRVKDAEWRPQIEIEEAGAAIERGGRFTDAISFYEAVVNERAAPGKKRFTQERWLVSKERQLDYVRTQNDEARVREILRDINLGVAELKLKSVDEISRFPDLAPLEVPTLIPRQVGPEPEVADQVPVSPAQPGPPDDQRNEPIVVTLGDFRFEVLRRLGRCRLTNTSTLESVTISLVERTVVGDVPFEESVNGLWVCERWQIVVELPSEQSDDLIRVTAQESGVLMTIRR